MVGNARLNVTLDAERAAKLKLLAAQTHTHTLPATTRARVGRTLVSLGRLPLLGLH